VPTHPPIQWVTGALYTALKQSGRQADRLPAFIIVLRISGTLLPLFHAPSWRAKG